MTSPSDRSRARFARIVAYSKCVKEAKAFYVESMLYILGVVVAGAFLGPLQFIRHLVWGLIFVGVSGYWLQKSLNDCDPVLPSPIILDLDGDGVEADGVAYFDHEGDGWVEASRWAGEDDGTLVWDRNGDGIINDGSELFGDNTVLANGEKAAHGFEALAELDTNNDGVVNASDAAWSNLQILRWTDANENGMMDDGEEYLVSLAEAGVSSLGTRSYDSRYQSADGSFGSGSTSSRSSGGSRRSGGSRVRISGTPLSSSDPDTRPSYIDASGNSHFQKGNYVGTDGVERAMTDVWFVTAPGMTQYDRSGIPAHSEVIASLPEASRGGRVYSLRDAMALDDATDDAGNSLLVAPYYSNTRTNPSSLRELVETFDWVDTASRSHSKDWLYMPNSGSESISRLSHLSNTGG